MYVRMILPLDRPEMPVIVDAVNITSDSLILQWLVPHNNNAPLTGYRIEYHTQNISQYFQIVPQTSYLITGLLPAVTYNFTLVAYNIIGNSLPSLGINVTTLEAGKKIL